MRELFFVDLFIFSQTHFANDLNFKNNFKKIGSIEIHVKGFYLRGFPAQNIGSNSICKKINQMIDSFNIIFIGVLEPEDSEFSIKFFEKCQLKGVKCNFAKLTIELSDLLVIGVFKLVDSEFSIKFFEKCQLKGVKHDLC